MGLEARAREQSGVPNPCRRVLLIAQTKGRGAGPRRPVGAAPRPYLLFSLRLPQLTLCRINFLLRLLAKKNPAELVALDSIGR